MKRYKNKPAIKKTSSKKWLLVGLFLVLTIIIAALVISKAHLFRKTEDTTTSRVPVHTASPNTKGETPDRNQSTPKNSDTPTDTPAINLIEPSGVFVSNHRPNLGGTPAPNTVQSVCTTSPGATCQIIFTNGGTVKSLTAQTTDSGGATYWSWKLQDIGLTAGTWHVQAKASYGSQTKTADDASDLEVAP